MAQRVLTPALGTHTRCFYAVPGKGTGWEAAPSESQTTGRSRKGTQKERTLCTVCKPTGGHSRRASQSAETSECSAGSSLRQGRPSGWVRAGSRNLSSYPTRNSATRSSGFSGSKRSALAGRSATRSSLATRLARREGSRAGKNGSGGAG